MKNWIQRKIAFVLAASDHGPMIVNRFDYRTVADGGSFGVGFDLLEASSFSSNEVDLVLSMLELRRRYFGDGLVAIDCGANIGVHTIEWARAMTGWGEVNRRVVLVHAKASKKFREFSASAVQEVCAQAQKNTSPFSTFALQRMGNYDQWNRPHKFTGDEKVSLTIKNRIRKPPGYRAKDAWEELSELLYNPLTAREIWLVLGNMLSAERFDAGLRSNDPAPETLQLNHLLQTTIAAGASVGAKTRIFCAP